MGILSTHLFLPSIWSESVTRRSDYVILLSVFLFCHRVTTTFQIVCSLWVGLANQKLVSFFLALIAAGFASTGANRLYHRRSVITSLIILKHTNRTNRKKFVVSSMILTRTLISTQHSPLSSSVLTTYINAYSISIGKEGESKLNRMTEHYPRCKSGMMRIMIRITIIAWDLCRAVDLECYIASTVLPSLDQDVLCL